MKNTSKLSLFAAVVLRTLLLILPVSALATAGDGQEIGVPQAMEAPVKGCFGAVLSPDEDRFYTVHEGLLTQYQIKPFKKIGSIAIIDWEHVTKAEFITHMLKIEVGVGRRCRVLMTNDQSKLIIIDRYRIFLLDARNGKILNKLERRERGRGMGAAVINDNDLLILDFDPDEQEDGRYSGEHGERKISLVIWDANTLKLKRKFNDLGESFGFVQDGELRESMSKIRDRIYLASGRSFAVLNSKTYAPELTGSFRERVQLSKDFKKLYVWSASKVTDHLTGKQTSYDDVKGSVLVFDQKTREVSIEPVGNIAREEFHPLLVHSSQISRNKGYVMLSVSPGRALLVNLNTGMRFRFNQYESGEAIWQGCSIGSFKGCKEFQLTPGARKYLMMKNEGGKIVPIDDATFTKYQRGEERR